MKIYEKLIKKHLFRDISLILLKKDAELKLSKIIKIKKLKDSIKNKEK